MLLFLTGGGVGMISASDFVHVLQQLRSRCFVFLTGRSAVHGSLKRDRREIEACASAPGDEIVGCCLMGAVAGMISAPGFIHVLQRLRSRSASPESAQLRSKLLEL